MRCGGVRQGVVRFGETLQTAALEPSGSSAALYRAVMLRLNQERCGWAWRGEVWCVEAWRGLVIYRKGASAPFLVIG